MVDIANMAQEARKAAAILAKATTQQKNQALTIMAKLLLKNKDEIIAANEQDRRKAREKGLPQNLVNRLLFDEGKITSRQKALLDIVALPDPIGSVDEFLRRPGGLEVKKVRVPLGLIGMIYESRPHVTINGGALCLKSGNAVILRGGSEAMTTNIAIGKLWMEALGQADLPLECIQVVPSPDRAIVDAMLSMSEYFDVIIPRGGKSLVEAVSQKSKVPVIKHYHGICHQFIDSYVDHDMAIKIAINSKTLMPEVCNALETILLHRDIAPSLLPRLAEALRNERVEVRGCPRTKELVPWVNEATEADWSTEYLDLIISIKVVSSVGEAIEHINRYGSHHTDTITSNNFANIKRFEQEVDSAVVLVNASTMFNDGGELGMGAEIGISTDKLHARGPVGMRDLTSYKYVVIGEGHIMT